MTDKILKPRFNEGKIELFALEDTGLQREEANPPWFDKRNVRTVNIVWSAAIAEHLRLELFLFRYYCY